MQQPTSRVICHCDLDAFYAQVEVKMHPQLRGKPVGVVQYNPFGDLASHVPEENRVMPSSNGSLIAVSYEARGSGVKRNMRGDQARAVCPDIQLVQVPTAHGKADLTLYRAEGSKVLDILARLGKTERASIDECYVDLTEEAHRRLEACGGVPPLPVNPDQVHVMQAAGFAGAAAWWQRPPEAWQPGERLLACAAAAAADLRAAVLAELGYTCSAGIAHTKLMAKLCSGLHKPAQQTVLPAGAVPALLDPLPIPKLRGLGGKFGEQVMAALGVETVGQLAATPLPRLEAAFGDKEAAWLHAIARGITDDAVEERKLPKSMSCGKTFRGRSVLKDLQAVHKWLLELGGELSERLEAEQQLNDRVPQLLTVGFSTSPPWEVTQQGQYQTPAGYHSTSRSCPLRKIDAAAIAEDAAALVRRWAAEQGAGWAISSLFMSAGNFVQTGGAAAITRYFKPLQPAAGAAAAGSAASGDVVAGEEEEEDVQQQQQAGSGSEWAAGDAGAGPSSSSDGLQPDPQQQPQQQQQQQQQQQPSRPVDAAGPSSSRPAGRQQPQLPDGAAADAAGPSGSRPGQPAGTFQQQQVDEAVLAELPPELQREIRAQMDVERLSSHFKGKQQAVGSGSRAGGSGGSGGKRPASSGNGSGQQRIDVFLKGKRPKR